MILFICSDTVRSHVICLRLPPLIIRGSLTPVQQFTYRSIARFFMILGRFIRLKLEWVAVRMPKRAVVTA